MALTKSIFLFLTSHKRLTLICLRPTHEAAAQCTLCLFNSPCRQNRDPSFLLTSINAHQARLLSQFLSWQHVQSLCKLQNSQISVIIFVTFHLYTDFGFHSSLQLNCYSKLFTMYFMQWRQLQIYFLQSWLLFERLSICRFLMQSNPMHEIPANKLKKPQDYQGPSLYLGLQKH